MSPGKLPEVDLWGEPVIPKGGLPPSPLPTVQLEPANPLPDLLVKAEKWRQQAVQAHEDNFNGDSEALSRYGEALSHYREIVHCIGLVDRHVLETMVVSAEKELRELERRATLLEKALSMGYSEVLVEKRDRIVSHWCRLQDQVGILRKQVIFTGE